MKITEKVAFNIASDVQHLSGQKLIKNAKNGTFGRVFENHSLRSNSVTRQVPLIGQKLVENAKIQKFEMRHFG